MTTLEQISHETMVFMRGNYRLDEIGDGKDVLKFMQGRGRLSPSISMMTDIHS